MIDFSTMPKVELHLHVEGAIPLEAMWELVQRHGGDPAVRTPADLARRFTYRDFPHFISTWEWKLQFHTTPEDYEFMAEAVAADLASQGHLYVEAFVSPADSGLDTIAMLMAVRRGLDRVAGIDIRLVPDLVRDTGVERSTATVRDVIACADDVGAVGITIGGSEQAHPPAPFAPVYEIAREAGLRSSAHAGEAAGPESVRDALDVLGVDRIGHGVRSTEDPALVAELVDRAVPLEVCPTSNIRTGVVDGWDGHPVLALIDAGAVVTINTDDPAMFGCDLAGEYRALEVAGVDQAALRRISTAAVDASWAPPATKRTLRDRLDRWWEQVEGPVASPG